MSSHNHKYLDISLDEMIAREGITASSSADNNKVRTKSSIQFTVPNNDNESKLFKKRKAAEMDDEDDRRGSYSSIKGGNINRSGSQFPDNCGAIFVSNLKYEVTDDDIQQLFESFGKVFRAALNFDRTGRSSGTAFVVYNKKADAIKAIGSLKGITLDGRALQMELIDPIGGNSSSYGGARANNSGSNQNSGKRGIWNDIASNYDNTPGSGGDKRQERGYDRSQRWNKSDKDLSVSVDDLDADLDSYLAARNANNNANKMEHE